MLVKDIFKQLYIHSVNKMDPEWELEFDYKQEVVIEVVEIFLQTELMALFSVYQVSEHVIPIVHKHFDEIIEWKHKSELNDYKEIFSYLQFTWGICATTQLNYDGEFIYCFDVFMKSVFDRTYKNGEQYDLKKIDPYRFLYSRNRYISNSKSVIEQWFSQLYYYSKSFSGLNEWCEYFFDDVYYYLNEGFQIESYHPQFLSNLLSWCEVSFNFKGSRAIRNIIEREYNSISWSNNIEKNEIKGKLGLQLLICSNYKNQEKGNLYTELESNFNFDPLSKMQATIALCFDKEALINNINQLIISIKKYNKYLLGQKLTIIDFIYQRARIFKILPILIASEIGNSDIIEELLLNYYDIKNPQKKGRTLFIIPNKLKKVSYCFNDKSVFDEKDSQKVIIELINIENSAFNVFRLLKGGVKQNITTSGKSIGQPRPEMANAYENKLLELYNFTKIEHEIQNVDSLCQFDFNSFPLQSLMIKSIQKTLPINLSLSKKLEFSKADKVLFWSGYSQTSEIEKGALQEIFDYANVEFEVHDEQNSDLAKFKGRINEFKPDIIWISSHGEHHHYEPNISSIKLSETESIGIRDFELLINNDNKRRLLFLNICEGGVHTQTGEFKNLGFPNLLTSDNQDVISHLWMAEPRFAYVFGVFLALGITILQKNYFEAFEYSLSIVLSNKSAILEELESFPIDFIDLKERVQNNDGTEWGNLITTGSPVYNI